MLLNNFYSRLLTKTLNSNRFIIRQFYDVRTKDYTIFAPATPISPGAKGSPLGVIRVSGTRSKNVIMKLTRLSHDSLKPRHAILSKVSKLHEPDEIIDIGLIIWFPKPKSFTGEDVCEFHLHGSQAIMRSVLDQLGQMTGLRPAEPGEFTKRAVLNKKMSLIQAESLPDLIASRTEKQRKLALRGLEGHVVARYEQWSSKLMKILAHLEASIDFGEDELIGEHVVDSCIHGLIVLSNELENYIRYQTRTSNYIRNGFKLAIMGRPNVGKSSLMNKLCQAERSIVSNVCGTTRDVIEQSFELGGHSLTLSDTAGLRDINDQNETAEGVPSHDSIEKEGIKRALTVGSKADVIIYVIDVDHLIESDMVSIISEEIFTVLVAMCDKTNSHETNQKILHLVLNKIDKETNLTNGLDEIFSKLVETIEHKMQYSALNDRFSVISSSISCKSEQNLEAMVEKLSHQLDKLVSSDNKDETAAINWEFVNERHLSFLRSCQKHVQKASTMHLAKIDLMAQHVREATDYLSRCLGTVTNEQILDIIFKDFCIGK